MLQTARLSQAIIEICHSW